MGLASSTAACGSAGGRALVEFLLFSTCLAFVNLNGAKLTLCQTRRALQD